MYFFFKASHWPTQGHMISSQASHWPTPAHLFPPSLPHKTIKKNVLKERLNEINHCLLKGFQKEQHI